MSDALGDAYHSIKAALDIFKQSAAPTTDVPTKQVLVLQAERVKAEAAKIGLMCSGSTPPTDQLCSLACSLQCSCVAFCSSCHSLTAAAGPSLNQELVKLAQGLVNPCLVLLKEMAIGKDLKHHVAVVWDGVAAVSKAPLDNKACLFKGLAGIMAVLKDTAREMEELQQEQQVRYGDAAATSSAAAAAAAEPSTSGTGAGEQPSSSSQPSTAATAAKQAAHDEDEEASEPDGDDDLDYEGGQMSGVERQLLASSLQLLAASTNTLKAFGKALLQGSELRLGTDSLDSWESCLFHARHLKRAAEDLGAAVYPPQDFEEVASAALAVYEVTELMADECPDAEAVGVEQLTSLAAALTAAHEHMQELLLAAQQEVNNEEGEAAAAAEQ